MTVSRDDTDFDSRDGNYWKGAMWLPTAYMGWIGLFFLAGAVFTGLTAYLYHEKIYNEQKQKVSRFRGFSHVNLFSLQYIGTLRAQA